MEFAHTGKGVPEAARIAAGGGESLARVATLRDPGVRVTALVPHTLMRKGDDHGQRTTLRALGVKFARSAVDGACRNRPGRHGRHDARRDDGHTGAGRNDGWHDGWRHDGRHDALHGTHLDYHA